MCLYFNSISDPQSCLLHTYSKCYENKMDCISNGYKYEETSECRKQGSSRMCACIEIVIDFQIEWQYQLFETIMFHFLVENVTAHACICVASQVSNFVFGCPHSTFFHLCMCVWITNVFAFFYFILQPSLHKIKYYELLSNYNKRKKNIRKVSFE